jgi:hypothetical protein
VFEEKLKIMHFGSIQINFACIHVSYFSNFQSELICIDTYEIVSIHSSSVWTERYSCIDTCLHASIHASKQLTCIDTYYCLYLVFMAFHFFYRMNNLFCYFVTFFISIWLYGYYLMLLCFEQHFTLVCMTLFWIISYVWIIIVCLCI